MRRREKFVISAVLLSLGLFGLQYLSLEWRYLGILVFIIITYMASAWALKEDLQPHEWLTILPFPAVYAAAVALFYFLLPSNTVSQFTILLVFGVGMYALYLSSNIFSVAKGRTIQLLYAAHAVELFFNLLTSLLLTNTIFSLRLPWYGNALLVGAIHFLIVLMSLWSVKLENRISREVLVLTMFTSIILAQFTALFSLIPMAIWHSSLFVMAILYVALSVLHNLLKGRLFRTTFQEFTLVAVLLCILFVVMFPLK